MKRVDPKFIVQVIEYQTGKVVKTSQPMLERKANKVDGGMNRNLNHDRFFTCIAPVVAPR